MRMAPYTDRFELVVLLATDPGVDNIGCEDIATEEEVAVASEGFKKERPLVGMR